jgi:hypothetical protein
VTPSQPDGAIVRQGDLLLCDEPGGAPHDRSRADKAVDEEHPTCLQGDYQYLAGEAAVGDETSQAAPKKPTQALGQDSKQTGIAAMTRRQCNGDALAGLRLNAERETIATQPEVGAGPVLLERNQREGVVEPTLVTTVGTQERFSAEERLSPLCAAEGRPALRRTGRPHGCCPS